METVFLLSGGDGKMHMFKEVRWLDEYFQRGCKMSVFKDLRLQDAYDCSNS